MASLGGDLQTLLFNFTFCSAKAEVKNTLQNATYVDLVFHTK
ncbi:hypothetical protein PPRY_a0810 [Pseudoalteromonas prydzensis ACAM 620]|nr:hypothetical protein [Pseudoalteromonas prydzensis]MBE0378170.1 hypothetical protein [Pseudoalteromonas prydzensis ACAM 620]